MPAAAPGVAAGAAAPAGPPPLPVSPFRDCPTCPEMVVVPAGTFVLGTSGDAVEVDRARGEAPPLPVTMNRAYAIGRYEVTVAQWREFVIATQYVTPADCRILSGGAWIRLRDRDWQNPGFATPQGDDEPVVCVSWDDAKAYVDWLSKQTGQRYRLPSETEWEYAARGGTTSPRYFGNRDSHEETALSVACDYANVYDASAVTMLDLGVPNANCNDQRTYAAQVGSFAANAFDLHDAIGNVREWLQDCYTASYQERPQDGRAWEWAGGCELRGVRGGSFATRPAGARSAARDAELQGLRQSDLGFRIARDL
ncbi:MAG: formylglycine-generating enzyme family protein [Steroidobacteraceae bacterium]|nr:formylglycine-generating enzyme family protein [Steroidobacteraceae bacterium]